MRFPTSKYLAIPFIFFSINFLNHLQTNVASSTTTTQPKNRKVAAIIVFGDSIVDPGNNNNIKTIVKCNFPPYGRDFKGGIPTGRFSNGKVPSDLLAEAFGVKELLPAYLDPKLQTQDLLTGVSFASGAAGYDPLTAKIASVLSLDDQLNLFKDYLKKMKGEVGENRTESIVAESIFIVCTGSDDIANTFFSTPFRRSHYDIPSYTDLMIRSASSFFQELYGLGARKIGVLSLPSIGCVPSQRTLSGGINRECSEAANKAAILFNSKLSSLLNSLTQKLPHSKFIYLDIYNLLLDLIQNPSQYGFEVVDKGCCGTGNIEVSILCNPYVPTTCPNADKYLFWDSYHPSQKAYEILTHQAVTKNIDKFF